MAAGETIRILWASDFPKHCFTVTRVYDKQTLIELVRSRALKFGEFTLASGKKASYYLDGKQVTLDSFGAGSSPMGFSICWPTNCRCPTRSAAWRSAPIRSRRP